MENSALVTCFRMSSYFRKDLKNLWCTVPPQVPPSIQSGQQNGRGPRRTVNGRLHTMQRPVSPVSRPPV